jgi:hypothetical protein
VSTGSPTDRDPEVPEADALDQQREVDPEPEGDGVPALGPEVPEADALDQQREVPPPD